MSIPTETVEALARDYFAAKDTFTREQYLRRYHRECSDEDRLSAARENLLAAEKALRKVVK